jgi:hypothetical protein
MAEGIAQSGNEHTFKERLQAYIWEPEYVPYEHYELDWIKAERSVR